MQLHAREHTDVDKLVRLTTIGRRWHCLSDVVPPQASLSCQWRPVAAACASWRCQLPALFLLQAVRVPLGVRAAVQCRIYAVTLKMLPQKLFHQLGFNRQRKNAIWKSNVKECNFSDESNSKMQRVCIGMCPPSILADTQPGISLFDHNRAPHAHSTSPRIVLWLLSSVCTLLRCTGEMLIGPSPPLS